MKKVIKNGMVAVLIQPSFGAGWSTWSSVHQNVLLFHPKLIQAKTDNVQNIEPVLKEILGDNYVCVLDWGNVQITWVKKGRRFQVHEYDGSESLVFMDQQKYVTA